MDTYSLNVYYFPVSWQVNLTYKIVFFFSQDVVCTHICTVACVFILPTLKADFAFATVLLLLRFLGKIAFFQSELLSKMHGNFTWLFPPPPKKELPLYMHHTLPLEKQATAAEMWTGFTACR